LIVVLASTELVVLNGISIGEAVAPRRIHELLGNPSRIHSAGPPAPYGHRNNQIHVYDSLGLYFNEHHYTQSLIGMSLGFWPAQEGYPFTPAIGFSGSLRLANYEVPHEVSEREFLANCHLPFKRHLAGIWTLDGRIPIGLHTTGSRLKSGRRSTARRLVSVDISWPHDPHAEALIDD
jgi:hypothetical protein